MGSDHSFDVVSKINLQELRNAIQQAQREIGTRFDFKGSSASVTLEESPLVLKVTADHHAQLNSVTEVVNSKLAKRGVALNAFAWDDPEQLPSGSMKRQASVQQGLSHEKTKEILKVVKELGLKVQSRVEGDLVRVSGKQLDDLQVVINALQAKNFGIPIQAENYR